MSAYPGSPSVSAEAREKVVQTFLHTLSLAREGRNEEALLGCDFILKMDGRFAPARRLLESLRGVPVGQVIDLAPFSDVVSPSAPDEVFDAIEEVSAPLSEPAAPPPPPPPRAANAHPPVAPPSPTAAAPSSPGALDDLVFDDFASSSPSPPSGAQSPSGSVEAASAGRHDLPPSSSPPPPPSDVSSAGSPLGGLDDLVFGEAPSVGPSRPAESPLPAAAPELAAKPSAAVDPRVAQFLRQGDEALARGNAQEAIDLWSRVFLIDLSNEEASRRIDAARQAQAEAARTIDVLLSEGIHSYEAGDLAGARNKFLGVLALSEHDATARTYLNQIDTAMAPSQPTFPSSSVSSSTFLKEELEAPALPSFAQGEGGLEATLGSVGMGEEAPALPAIPLESERRSSRGGLDIRILVGAGALLLVVAGVGTWWYLTHRLSTSGAEPRSTAAVSPRTRGSSRGPTPGAEDLFARAQALYEKGQIDQAVQILASVPESDPRRVEAITKIDQYRSSAFPTPAVPPSAAGLEQLKLTGLAALQSSRYIDAVKSLDRYTQARPGDTEAIQALNRAREQVRAMGSAVKSYNESDYESAIKLLWTLRKQDPKNQDVEDYLLNAYVNSAIQSLQAGNMAKAQAALQEAIGIRPSDEQAQRLLRFARKYSKGATDLLSKIFIKNLGLRP